MNVTVITPINDINYINNAIKNFEQQEYKYKELLLILNGDIVTKENLEIISKLGYLNCIYNQETNMGKIRNVGLDWMKQNNKEIFSFFDSDDEYLPGYLVEAVQYLDQNKTKLIGKMNFRFKSGTDLYEMVGLDGVNTTIQGPTITGYLTKERFKPFVTAEDIEFVQRHEVEITSVDNFVYNVRDDSIQKRSLTKFLEFFKSYHTIFKNEKFKILKNSEIFWEYGMEHDPIDFWK